MATMTTVQKLVTMDCAVCPSCAVVIPKRNSGCPHCDYSFPENKHGRIGTLRQVMNAKMGAFDHVSPAFLRVFAQAAAAV